MQYFFGNRLAKLAANFSGSTHAIRLLICLVVIELIWAKIAGITLLNFEIGLAAAMTPLLAGMVIDATGYAKRIAHIAHYLALWWLSLIIFRVFTYLCATFSFPLMDMHLSSIDVAIGFDWVNWSRYVKNYLYLNNFLEAAYNSALVQIYFAIIFFSHSKRRAGAHEFWWTTVFALLITSVISAFVPALGTFFYYKENVEAAIHIPDLLALRKGTLATFPVLTLGGIITFPSFHMVLVCLLCYPYRYYKKILPLVVLVNCFMMFSIPSHGGHYLVDIAAGAAVACVSIILYKKLMRYESSFFARKTDHLIAVVNI